MNEDITYPAPIEKGCSSSDRTHPYISPTKTQQLSSVMGSIALTPQVEEGTEAIQPDQQSINSTITGLQPGLPDLSSTEIITNDHNIPDQSASSEDATSSCPADIYERPVEQVRHSPYPLRVRHPKKQ